MTRSGPSNRPRPTRKAVGSAQCRCGLTRPTKPYLAGERVALSRMQVGVRLPFDAIRHGVRVDFYAQPFQLHDRYAPPTNCLHLDRAEGLEIGTRPQQVRLRAICQSRESATDCGLASLITRRSPRFSGVSRRGSAAADSTLGRDASSGAAMSPRAAAHLGEKRFPSLYLHQSPFPFCRRCQSRRR
jgi:hypothetical protein